MPDRNLDFWLFKQAWNRRSNAPDQVPDALRAQLAEGGILVAPVGWDKNQRLLRWRSRGGEFVEEDLGPIRFVPMVHGP